MGDKECIDKDCRAKLEIQQVAITRLETTQVLMADVDAKQMKQVNETLENIGIDQRQILLQMATQKGHKAGSHAVLGVLYTVFGASMILLIKSFVLK